MGLQHHPASTILRWALAFTFFYAAVASLLHPNDWIGYFPGFLRSAIPSAFLLASFSIYEIVLALWLFWGRRLAWAALLAFVTLAGIVVFNLGILDQVFRDVGLALTALALYTLANEAK